MEVIVKKRLADQIYEVLKKRIVEMTLKPESKIDVKNLSKEFGVSETPVRSALNKLAHERGGENRYFGEINPLWLINHRKR